MIRTNLDERHRRILRSVVETHVVSAEPVGSQYVRVAYHLSISPATIRGAMQRLEEEGLLDHPHTSAGRVPTEAGYRYYVDTLMEPESLPPATRRAVDAAFDRDDIRGGEDLDATTSRVLAKTSHQLALVALRPWVDQAIERVDLVALEDGVILLALGEGGARVGTATWRPEGRFDAALVLRAGRWIGARLPLRDATEFATLKRAALETAPSDIVAIITDALDRGAKLLESLRQPAVRIEGAENIAAQPEFKSADRLRGLVSLLAEREPLTRALGRFVDSGSARITIGRENGEGPMCTCSLVGTGIAAGSLRGSLGVMGPVRMPYRRLVSLVSYIGERLAGCA